MKIKRFKAPDMRAAIKMVREEHGADAVILSNRKVRGGIEIISAIDYDEGAIEKILNQNGVTTSADPAYNNSVAPAPVDPVAVNPVAQARANNYRQHQDHQGYSTSEYTPGPASDAPVQPDLNTTPAGMDRAVRSAGEPVDDFSVNQEELERMLRNKQQHIDAGEDPAVPVHQPAKPPVSQPIAGGRESMAQKTGSVPVREEAPVAAQTRLAPTEKPEQKKSHQRDLEMMAMKRELDTLKGLLNSQFNPPGRTGYSQVNPMHNGIFTRLQELGLASDLCHEIIQQLPMSTELNEGWRKALALLSHKIKICDEDVLDTGGIIAMVGSTGVGKTTTIAKLAARFALKHGRDKVALVTTDNYRVAAQDQMLSYGQMLGIPVYLANSAAQLNKTLGDLHEKHFVLIDTTGVGQRDKRIDEVLELLDSIPYEFSTYLTLAANTQKMALNQVARKFSRLDLAGCFLTKLDEAVSLGGLLSVLVKARLPVSHICEGQAVPEDMQRARPYSLVSKAVTLMQQAEILNSSSSTVDATEGLYNAHVS